MLAPSLYHAKELSAFPPVVRPLPAQEESPGVCSDFDFARRLGAKQPFADGVLGADRNVGARGAHSHSELHCTCANDTAATRGLTPAHRLRSPGTGGPGARQGSPSVSASVGRGEHDGALPEFAGELASARSPRRVPRPLAPEADGGAAP